MVLPIFKHHFPNTSEQSSSMKTLVLPTLLAQIPENTKTKGEIPLTFPGTYSAEGYFIQCAASLYNVKVAKIPRAPGNGRQACCGHSLSAYISKIRTKPQKA